MLLWLRLNNVNKETGICAFKILNISKSKNVWFTLFGDLGGSLCYVIFVQDSSFWEICGVKRYVLVHTLHSIQHGHKNTHYPVPKLQGNTYVLDSPPEPHLYARYLCSRDALGLKAGQARRATIGYLVYKNRTYDNRRRLNTFAVIVNDQLKRETLTLIIC